MSAITVTPSAIARRRGPIRPGRPPAGHGDLPRAAGGRHVLRRSAINVDGNLHSIFILTASPAINVSPITMDVRWISIILAIVCAGLGALLFTWRRSRGTYAIFTLGTIVFLWSFLTWAARGRRSTSSACSPGR